MVASGHAGHNLVFAQWHGRNYARVWFRPTNPKTAAQTAQRNLFAAAVAAWQSLYPAQQDQWRIAARDVYPPITGFNYYVMQYIIQAGPPTIPAIAPKRGATLQT